MDYKKIILIIFLISNLYASTQPSGREYRRSAIHNGNLVRTVFGNYGVIAQPGNKGPRGAWIHDNNGYIGDISLIVGAEITSPDIETGEMKTFHSTVVCPVDRPISGSVEQSENGENWGFEPVAGYFNDYQESIAMSTSTGSWPTSWPDKNSEWDGSWNGFFGKDLQFIQQESYYVMDDNNDREFNFPENNMWNVEFKPDSLNLSRNGLGLEVRVRGMQWQQFMAQDCLFWLYEITNTSTTDYSKVAFGELVGTYVGVTGASSEGNEYDDDWSFFDVNEDMTFTGDYDDDCSRNPNWVGDVGMVGYAFLESPGNPYDGIDNDGDAIDQAGSNLFEEADFDSIYIYSGFNAISIDDNYNRSIIMITEEIDIETRGGVITVIPGETYLSEGNILIDENGEEVINPNAFDGIDNDLDGLIDENYFVHYRQRKIDQDGTVLFDIINPRRYVNYVDFGENTNPLIDERRDDGIDNDGDWNPEFHDVGEDGVMDTGDSGENDGLPTAGEPNFDETDPDESDQIGLTSFDYFTPANDFPHSNDEELWNKLAPGFFDVPSSIENGEPVAGEDGDFIFGSGYFPLRAGQTERFSIALVFGEDNEDLLRNKRTVQNIYDQEYKFPPPPTKPTLTAVSGDNQVTLYWDRKAEEYMDPILHKFDFQGYKIYRATDPNFNDVRNITNAMGVIEGYEPLAQFDKNDDIDGFFYPTEELFQASQGYSFYLGENTGLVHKYIDTDVQNGRTYYYALVAYDHGNPEDLFPAENSKFISVLPNGEIITDINTAVITPNSVVAGLKTISNMDSITVFGNGTGNVTLEIINEQSLIGNEYTLIFDDTSNDSIDNDNDGLLDYLDLDEFPAVTTTYSILDENEKRVELFFEDSLYVDLNYQYIDVESFFIINEINQIISKEDYYLDFLNGKIILVNLDLLNINLVAQFKYYPLFKSPYIQGSPFVDEDLDTESFDGLRLNFNNDWNIEFDENNSFWKIKNENNGWDINPDSTFGYSFDEKIIYFGEEPLFIPNKIPNNYALIFSDSIGFGRANINSSFNFENTGDLTNFKLVDLTNNIDVEYFFYESERPDVIDEQDIIYYHELDTLGNYHYSWSLYFYDDNSDGPEYYNFGDEDTLFLFTKKPFRDGDVATIQIPQIEIDNDNEINQLDKIRVVPNPYIVATKFESPLPPGITSGRGERRIEFRSVPNNSIIRIYTSRGQLVRTLKHDGNIFDGSVAWDLKTYENLDISFGVYFYVVESYLGVKKGKLAVIK